MSRANDIIKAAHAAACQHMTTTGCDYAGRLNYEIGGLTAAVKSLCGELEPTSDPKLTYCTVYSVDAGELLIGYTYSPGRPGRWYMPNGDPGYPDEPSEIDVVEVWAGNRCMSYEAFSSSVQAMIDEAVYADLDRLADQQQAEYYEEGEE